MYQKVLNSPLNSPKNNSKLIFTIVVDAPSRTASTASTASTARSASCPGLDFAHLETGHLRREFREGVGGCGSKVGRW